MSEDFQRNKIMGINICGIVSVLCVLINVTVSQASSITTAMRREDSRLEQSVTIDGYRLYVDELVERLAESTHAALSTSGKTIHNDRVSVGLHKIVVADAMNALRSVLSYQGATYEWSREKSSTGEWRYVLNAPSDNFQEKLDTLIKKDLEDEILRKIATVRASPEERRRMVTNIPPLIPSTRDEAAIRGLADLLTTEQIHNAIFAGETFDVSLEGNKELGKGFVDSERSIYNKANSSTPLVTAFPEPIGFRIEVRRASGRVGFDLWILQKTNTYRWGYPWAGGMPAENRWRTKIAELWRTKTDSDVTPSIATKKTKFLDNHNSQPEDVTNSQNALYTRLREMGDKANVSFIACIPQTSQITDPGAVALDMSVFNYLAKLHTVGIDCKSVGGILALTNHNLLFDSTELSSAPWSITKRLRRSCKNDSLGLLHWEDYCFTAATTTSEQLRGMSEPNQWWMDKWSDMEYIGRIQPLLAGLMDKPGLLKDFQDERDISVSDLPLKARVFVTQGSFYDAVRDYATVPASLQVAPMFVRLLSTDTLQQRLHQLQILDRDKKVFTSYEFYGSTWPSTSQSLPFSQPVR